MNNGYPAGEVRPMIDREPPNAAETRGASVRSRFGEPQGLVRAFSALPIALERRIVGFRKPATGESRTNTLVARRRQRHVGSTSGGSYARHSRVVR
jgi:hypothetical protein